MNLVLDFVAKIVLKKKSNGSKYAIRNTRADESLSEW